jgi:1-acyl-sn-glycerol-3-phosphate acyltransferase
VLFPEGKRSRDGKMAPFKAGLGVLVAETSVPVIPCYLEGCYEALHAETKWPHPKRITVHIGKPLVFSDVSNDREGWLRIATETEAQIKAHMKPNSEKESSPPPSDPPAAP